MIPLSRQHTSRCVLFITRNNRWPNNSDVSRMGGRAHAQHMPLHRGTIRLPIARWITMSQPQSVTHFMTDYQLGWSLRGHRSGKGSTRWCASARSRTGEALKGIVHILGPFVTHRIELDRDQFEWNVVHFWRAAPICSLGPTRIRHSSAEHSWRNRPISDNLFYNNIWRTASRLDRLKWHA